MLTTSIATFSGCQIVSPTKEQTKETSDKKTTTKEPSDYLEGIKEMGLDVKDEASIDVNTLPKEVAPISGVSFNGNSDTAMKLLLFDNQEAANTAKSYYVSQEQKTYTNANLLFVSERTMADGWFEKYRDSIFKQ